jgi:hypothetical protein
MSMVDYARPSHVCALACEVKLVEQWYSCISVADLRLTFEPIYLGCPFAGWGKVTL